MATAKKAAPAKAAKSVTKKTAVKAPAKAAVKAPAAPAAVKPLKDVFNKTSLVAHVAAQSGVEPKAVKAVLGALDGAILGAVNKKGAGEFTLPGLLKIGVQKVPAKKARKGIDPFTKQERMFAAKPASVKIKVRALKKLKDAAI